MNDDTPKPNAPSDKPPKGYPWWARALGWMMSKLLGGKDGG